MRVLQLTGFYTPVIGGIEAYVQDLNEHLVEKGIYVTVIARYIIGEKPKKRIEHRGRIKIIWLTSRKGSKLATIWTWIKAFFIALREDFDVIHAHTILPINLVGNLLKSIKRKRLVCTIHETHFQQGIHNPFYRLIAKASLNYADYVTGISDDITAKANSLGLNKKVVTSKNAVNLSKFGRRKSDRIRRENKLAKKTYIMITTRRLVEKNGVIYLIRAMPSILKKCDVFLLLIGNGPEKEKILTEIDRLNLQRHVKIMSDLPSQDVVEYLNSADIFVLPSLIEGMSMSGLEALASRLPIVATNIGGNPQFTREGINGFLCRDKDPEDLAEKIVMLIDKGPKGFGKRSREIAEREFSWDERIKEWMRIYSAR